MNKKEKMYLIIVILLLVILIFKSFYLDEYKPLTKDEEIFKEYVEKIGYEKYKGFLYKNNLASFRVVSIKKIDDKGKSIIEKKNGNDNGYERVEIKGKYKAKIRKYLFHFLPYGEDGVLSRK
ncbi:hypothetical protein [Paramaledivibacter caminithermalis]|jgi:hypothetical protein|uniref:Uncharacterized protein n=1 Tax=Paramaledivibacter caminithermalis (strain DSM 15212 / CIP 107654 / DViRD3) TaxID=1121301 RepID=A0A1M6SCH3_PARC5|nr:hypothetical protein [Paramaledivibacter caminithermalis]SHK42405.1 hypothetical protein SAMN02745912_03265 [Paramaledivibacter caminithermalis DSM 15212]